jgi:pimeloyl-ACP methyl ester carboxylesterase
MNFFKTLFFPRIGVFIFAIFLSFNSYAQSNQALPRFEKADCAVTIPKNEKVECGYLVVRENRSAKNDKIIRLPVIVLKSDNPNPQPDPILRTLGGPGASSLRLVTGRKFSPWLKNRDMIVFEQRGTKYAQPALDCPEVDEAKIGGFKQRLDEAEIKRRELAAARACRDRLARSGIDLSAYNSAESAADIEDLRRVLKLEKINLYGVSYSARLMLNVARDYPKGVRSMVIESTLPLQVNYDEVGVDGINRTLNLLFSSCRADAECAKNFPNLENEFYAAVRNANAEPVEFAAEDAKTGESIPVRLNGNDFVTWAIDYLLSSDSQLIVSAPSQMHRVSSGDYAPLRDYVRDRLSPSFYSLGMRYSVWCREEFPFENAKKIAAQSSLYPNLKGYVVQNLPAICGVWNVAPAKSIENKPVKSDIPTMIIAGEYDAYTPPEWGKIAAKDLKNSYFFELPWLAHGAGFSAPSCVRDSISGFFDNPSIAPKIPCIERIRSFYKFAGKDGK